MTRLAFCDTETQGLHPGRRAWDVALIVRDPGKPDREFQWYVAVDDLDLGNADPKSLEIGRFYQRHPNAVAGERFIGETSPESWVMQRVEFLTRGAVLIGAVPSFDADVLGRRLRAHGLCPAWHYRPLCVETLALGWLAGACAVSTDAAAARTGAMPELPWRSSDELWPALGIEPAADADRHTALGDARSARDLFDAATGGHYRTT